MLNYYEARSIHIFGWMFTFKDKVKLFDKNTEWLENSGWKLRQPDLKSDIDYFGRHQYFTAEANQIFENKKLNICNIYDFPLFGNIRNIYRITLSDKRVYELDVDAVELHIYSYGVGILFLRCLNRNPKYELEDIKIINDLGRRTSIPFLPADLDDSRNPGNCEDGFILCADQVMLRINGKEIEDNYRERIVQNQDTEKGAEFPFVLLRGESAYDFHRIIKKTKKERIQPVLDDRMQLICLIRDKKLSYLLKNNRIKEDELCAIIHVDPESSSCQDDEMCKALVKDSVYPRWRKQGTIHAFTDYSAICLTDGIENVGINASVIKPFVTQYPYMVSIVLAQRAAIDLLSNMAGETAGKVNNKFALIRVLMIRPRLARQIQNLQCSYVRFSNQIMISDLTSQMQGQEIYQLLQKHHRIGERYALLEKQLQELYNLFAIMRGTSIASWANILAVIGLVLAIDFLDIISWSPCSAIVISIMVVFLFIIQFFF